MIVEKSFVKCGISNWPDGEEDYWLRKDCDDVPDEADNNECDPYDNAVTDAMLELFYSNSEDEQRLCSLYKSTPISWLYFFFRLRVVRRNMLYFSLIS